MNAQLASTVTSSTPEELLAQLRAPLASTTQVHLNNAGVAPLSPFADAAAREVLVLMREGSLGIGKLLASYERARATTAKLVNGNAHDVSFFQTCAAALSQVALGLALPEGAEIVRLDQEYPSNAYAWHRAAERVHGRVVVVDSLPTPR